MVEKQEKQEKLKLRTNWNEVTLEEYLQIGEIQGDEEIKLLSLQKRLRMIAVISNRSFEEICDYTSNNLKPIIEKAGFLDTDPPKHKKRPPFTINGIKYVWHPEFNNMKGGEMISIEQLLMDAHHNKKNATADILSILIRPVEMIPDPNKPGKEKVSIQKFDAETMADRKELFLKKLTAEKFIHELAFFFDEGKNKGGIIKLYSELMNPTLNQKPTKKATK